MLSGKLAAVDAEAHDIADFRLLFGRLEIVFHGKISQFRHTDAIAANHLQGKALARKFLVRAFAVKKFIHMDIDGVASGRKNNPLDACLVQTFGEILALAHALVLIIEAALFIESGSQGHNIVTGHAAVRIVAIAGNLFDLDEDTDVCLHAAIRIEVRELPPEAPTIAEGQHTAHIAMAVLLGGHGEAIAIREHFCGDLSDGFIGVALFIHFDEVAVLGPAGDIEHKGNIIFLGHLRCFADGSHGNSLPADGVIGDRRVNKRDILGADLLNEFDKLRDVHIALERILLIMAALRHFPEQFLMIEIARNRSHLLDIAFGGIEMAIGRDGVDLAWRALIENIAHDLEEHRFSRTSLLENKGIGPFHLSRASIEQAALLLMQIKPVHEQVDVLAVRAEQVEAPMPVLLPSTLKNIAESIEQHIIALVSTIGLIAQEERRPLLVGHGRRT